ncbi:MAG: hypothetical protein ACI9CF_001978 [Candidatus Omnitrophota bacterium]|jgi:hypothetical protein
MISTYLLYLEYTCHINNFNSLTFVIISIKLEVSVNTRLMHRLIVTQNVVIMALFTAILAFADKLCLGLSINPYL